MIKKIIALWHENPTWVEHIKSILTRNGYKSKEILADSVLEQYKVVLTDEIWDEYRVLEILKETFNKKILIADDYIILIENLKQKLQKEGYEVKLTYTVKNTIKELKKNKYDVLVLDYNFGERKTGLTVMKYINKHKLSIKVIPNSLEKHLDDELIKEGALNCCPQKNSKEILRILTII